MDTSQPTLANFLQHLRTDNQSFILRRDAAPPQWSDEALHRSNYDQNPELYALLAVADKVQPWQRVRILFQLLQRSRKGMSNEVRCTLVHLARKGVRKSGSDRQIRLGGFALCHDFCH